MQPVEEVELRGRGEVPLGVDQPIERLTPRTGHPFPFVRSDR